MLNQNGPCQSDEILLVEDNPGDARLTFEALKEAQIDSSLHVVEDGVQAMQFLRKQSPFAAAATPRLILLDLNLPKKSGQEVLAEIKEDPSLRSIPVIVLTTSTAEKDVLRAYDLHANCYIVKPVSFELFVDSIRKIKTFWFSTVRLPYAVEPRA